MSTRGILKFAAACMTAGLVLSACADDPLGPAPVASPAINFASASGAGAGGPLILMGIDAEDGGPGGHGPISVYVSVVNSILNNVANGGSGILVVGGGKSTTDDVTVFWNSIGTHTGQTITFVHGATAIASQSFGGFAVIGVASTIYDTFDGGLTEAENDALATRATDVAAFVNGGGGLLAFNASGFANPYGYLGDIGSFTFNFPYDYNDITPTTDGLDIGITNDLDICCWHDEYATFPSFLSVLATNAATGNAAAIGGARVIVAPPVLEVGIDIKPGSWPNAINLTNDQSANIAVAILTTSEFDAGTVDPSTVTLGDESGTDTPVATRKNGRLFASMEDVDGDMDLDLVLHFHRDALIANGDLTASTTELVLLGETNEGQNIRGVDAVWITPNT